MTELRPMTDESGPALDCGRCAGTGELLSGETCPNCDGEGEHNVEVIGGDG